MCVYVYIHEETDVLINLVVGIFSQCKLLSDHHIIHLDIRLYQL